MLCLFFSCFPPHKLGNICRQGLISKNFLKLWRFSLRGVSILPYFVGFVYFFLFVDASFFTYVDLMVLAEMKIMQLEKLSSGVDCVRTQIWCLKETG